MQYPLKQSSYHCIKQMTEHINRKVCKTVFGLLFFLACSDDLARIDERITLFVTYNPTVLGEAFIRNGLMIYDMPVSLSTNRLL